MKTLQLKKLSLDETLDHDNKNYNPTTWAQIVKGYTKYPKLEFFERTNNPNEYHELFVKYQIPEGITFFGRLSYSGSLSNGYFAQCKIENDNLLINEYVFPTDKDSRKLMANLSTNFNFIFTKI